MLTRLLYLIIEQDNNEELNFSSLTKLATTDSLGSRLCLDIIKNKIKKMDEYEGLKTQYVEVSLKCNKAVRVNNSSLTDEIR